MSISFGLSPWLLLLCALAAAGLTYWSYRRTVPRVSSARRGVLMGLRFLALFIVLFLLFEPVWRRFIRSERPPVLAVLMDNSQSLGLTVESGGDSLDVGRTMRQTVERLPQQDVGGEVRYFRFDTDVDALDAPRPGDSLTFEGARTDLSRALDFVREDLKDQNLRGVLLLTDGQYNTGRNPLYLSDRFPVPIYTVAVGDTASQRDIQIRRITANDIAYLHASLPVQVGLRADDFAGEQVVVSLMQNGQVLGSSSVQLPQGTAEVPVDLTYTPQEVGLQRLVVTVTRLPGEVTYRNNTETVTVRVLDSKRRILLLGAAPGPDLATVRQLLQEDPNVEVESFVQKGSGAFYEGSFPSSLEPYDLVIMVGYPGPAADEAVLSRIARAADDGLPLLFMLTRQTDLQAVSRRLSDVLPVTPSRNRSNFAEASFATTPRGRQHPIMDLPQVPSSLTALPPLVYNQSRWQVSPDARVLATVDVQGVRLDDPLLVVRRRAGSRSAVLLGSGTWRWKNLPRDLESYDAFWPSLFSNVTQWLTTPEDDRRVRVEPVRELFAGGESAEFTGQVYDESLNPINDASVSVNVTAPDNAQYPYVMESVGNGRYVLDVGALPEGTYTYEATAERNGVDLGADSGSFAVGALTVEFKETRADPTLLRQIAQRSGGTFFMPDQVNRLADVLTASSDFTSTTLEQTQETELWKLPALLALVVLLLTTEWFLRKRSGMV